MVYERRQRGWKLEHTLFSTRAWDEMVTRVEARTITNIEPISFPTSSQLCFNNNETGLPHQFAT